MLALYGRLVHSNSQADLRGKMNGILFLFLPIESLAWPDIKTWCRAPLKILHFSSVCGSPGPGWNWGGHLKDPRIRSSDFHHWQRLCETHNDILITILTLPQTSCLHPACLPACPPTLHYKTILLFSSNRDFQDPLSSIIMEKNVTEKFPRMRKSTFPK